MNFKCSTVTRAKSTTGSGPGACHAVRARAGTSRGSRARAERTWPARRAHLPALPPVPQRGLRRFQRKITLRQRAHCRPASPLGTSFQSCSHDEPRCKGASEAARPASSADRQDLGRAGPLTPVIQVCRLGGLETPSVPTHTHVEAVTKPEERGAQPPAPTSSGPVCHGESDAPCQLPEPGPGHAPMQ